MGGGLAAWLRARLGGWLSDCLSVWLGVSLSAWLNCWLTARVTVSVSSTNTNVSHHECECECERERARDRDRGRDGETQRAKNSMVWNAYPRIHTRSCSLFYPKTEINSWELQRLRFCFNLKFVWTHIPLETINIVFFRNSNINFGGNGTHIRYRFFRAQAWTTHGGSEIIVFEDWSRLNLKCWAYRRDSQRCTTNR